MNSYFCGADPARGQSRNQGVLAVLLVLLLALAPASLRAATILDDSFSPDLESANRPAVVYSAATQSDGKILVAGHFSSVNGAARIHLARLNADGTLDTSFDAGPIKYFISFVGESPDATVYGVAPQTNGTVIIGGYFNSFNGVTRNNLARLKSDGSLDTTYQANVNYTIYSMASQKDGKLLIAGAFTGVNGRSAQGLARLNADGTVDATFVFPGTFGVIHSVTVLTDGRILIAGGFTTIGNDSTKPLVARLNADGTVDSTFTPGFANIDFNVSAGVYSAAAQADGKVIFGGALATTNSLNIGLGRLNADGSLDNAFTATVDTPVHTVALQSDGKALIGGEFTNVNGVARLHLARLNADGSLDSAFLPGATGSDDTVEAIVVGAAGTALVGGEFAQVNAKAHGRLARLISDGPVGGLTLTISPTLITNDYQGKVTLKIAGLAPGQSAQIDTYLDENGDGIIAPDEPLAQSWTVTDGVLPFIGGARNLNVPGDEDGATNGAIQATLDFSRRTELDGLAIGYIFKVSSPTGSLAAATAPFTVVQKRSGQGIVGVVSDSSSSESTPGALVLLTSQGSPGLNVINSSYSDDLGQFALFSPASTNSLVALRPGYVSGSGGPQEFQTVTVSPHQSLTANLSLTPGVTTISGTAVDQTTGAPVPGVLVLGEGVSPDGKGLVSLGGTDTNGNLVVSTTPGTWSLSLLPKTLARMGYLAPTTVKSINTTTGSVSGFTLQLPRATALVNGQLTTADGQPLAGVTVTGNSVDGAYTTQTLTDTNGNYALGIGAGDWITSYQSDPYYGAYYNPQSVFVRTAAGQTTQRNLTMTPVSSGGLTISGFSPTNGAPGDTVTISGVGFAAATGVQLAGLNSGFTALSDTLISATVPSGATSGPWSVISSNAIVTSSASFSVTPPRPPVIGLQPASQTVAAGLSANFTVAATGTPPLSYQWRFNGADIPGATNAVLTLNNLALTDAGAYSVGVSNSGGTTPSVLAILTVKNNSGPSSAPTFSNVAKAGGGGNDFGAALALGANGVRVIAGVFEGTAAFGTNVLTSHGGQDIFVAKLDGLGNYLWAKSAGGAGNDQGRGIAVDALGNCYVAGYFTNTATFGGTTLVSRGGYDAFLMKLDSSGNLVWVKQLGGSGDDMGAGVGLDASGNSYVTGSFSGTASFGDYVLTSAGLTDLFLVKLDGAGNVIWAHGGGGPGADAGTTLAVDSVGFSYVVGRFSGTASFGSFSVNSGGGVDGFVAKFDSAGNPQWVRRVGGPLDDAASGVALDSAGNSYIVGQFSGVATFGTLNATSAGASDIFVAKYDNVGDALWVSVAGGAGPDAGLAVAANAAGDVFVTGSFSGAATFGALNFASAGGTDLFVAQYNTSGSLLWAKRAGGAGADAANAIAVDTRGALHLTGQFSGAASFDNFEVSAASGSDAFVAILSTQSTSAAPPVITAQPLSQTVTVGDDAVFSVNASGSSPFTYQWSFNGADLPGATNALLSLTRVNVGAAGAYSVAIANSVGSVVSGPATLTVNNPTGGVSPTFGGVVKVGGTGANTSNAIAVDANGNRYVTGLFQGVATFGSTTLTSRGANDIYISKLDPAGNYVWATQAGGTGDDEGVGVAVDNAGNTYVTGSFANTATFGPTTLTSRGGSDAFIAKYDPSGNVIWAQQAGGAANDFGNAVAVDSVGNAYVTGNFGGTGAFGVTNLVSAGGSDAYVAKFDSSGNVVWAQSAGGPGNDSGLAIAVGGGGNSYVAGRFSGTASIGGTNVTSAGGFDVFVSQLDPNGMAQWVKQLGGTNDENVWSIAADSAGNSYVAGDFSGSATIGSTNLSSKGGTDGYLVKYDRAGNPVFTTQVGGAGTDSAYNVAVDGAGNSYLTGTFSGTTTVGNTTLTSAGGQDAYVAQYDRAGNVQWVKQAGGTSDDAGTGIAVDPSGNVDVTGQFSGTSQFGGTSLTAGGPAATFVASLPTSSAVPAAPVITSQPQDMTVTAGDPVTFSVMASGSPPPAYQWSFNGVKLSGATNATLTFNNVSLSSAGAYSVTASNSLGSVISSNANLTVHVPVPPPGIINFTPASGAPGTQVTIAGSNLSGASAVNFNGVSAPFIVNSNGKITTVVPVGATTGTASVTTPGGTATSAAGFTVLSSANPPPSVVFNTPTNTQTFSPPANIVVMATASSPNGNIAHMDYYANGAPLTSLPTLEVPIIWTSFTWSNVLSGTYSLAVIATDDSGAKAIGGPLQIQVLSSPLRLQIAKSGTNAALSWTTNAVGYLLESTPSLTPPITWIALTNQPITTGTVFRAEVAIPGAGRVYRLRRGP